MGYAAFLLPVAMMLLSIRWFRGEKVESPNAKSCGVGLLVRSLTSLMTLLDFPAVRGALPGGGVIGALFSARLLAALNPAGAYVVSFSALFVGLFLTTSFSFFASAEWLRGPFGFVGRWRARYKAWREDASGCACRRRSNRFASPAARLPLRR